MSASAAPSRTATDTSASAAAAECECGVFSPCGRYLVHFRTDRRAVLSIDIRPNTSFSPSFLAGAPDASSSSVSASSFLSPSSPSSSTSVVGATLGAKDVAALTQAAGVTKPFSVFADMVYHALTGTSPSVRFFVETLAEMKHRIARDVRGNARGPQGAGGAASTVVTGSAGGSSGGSGNVNTTVNDSVHTTAAAKCQAGAPAAAMQTSSSSFINLSVSSDLAEELYSQRFFTLDYDVDFTRAVFPIALHPLTASSSGAAPPALFSSSSSASAPPAVAAPGPEATTTDAEDPSELANVTSGAVAAPQPAVAAHAHAHAHSAADTADAAGEVARLRRALWEAQQAAAHAHAENARLRREREALVQLSRDKMLEMERVCKDFAKSAGATAEMERLRARNVDLRAELQRVSEERDAALARLQRLAALAPHARSESAGSGRQRQRSARGRLVSPTPPLLEERLRRAQHQQQQQQQGSDRASARRSRLSTPQRQQPQPRRSTQHRRFDTPPAAPSPLATPPRADSTGQRHLRSPSGGGSGGRLRRSPSTDGGATYPGPRSPSHARDAPPSLPRKPRAPSVGAASSAASYGSRGSSRGSRASASHERLYRTPTASSYARRVPDAFTPTDNRSTPRDTRQRRAVFK